MGLTALNQVPNRTTTKANHKYIFYAELIFNSQGNGKNLLRIN